MNSYYYWNFLLIFVFFCSLSWSNSKSETEAGSFCVLDCDSTSTPNNFSDIKDILNISSSVQTCPYFLMSFTMNRDQRSILISGDISADKQCQSDLIDSQFNSNQEFENYLRSKDPFSEINGTSIADCLSHPFPVGTGRNKRRKIFPKDKHKALIAEYYSTQQRLHTGLNNALQDITAIDHLIGKPLLEGISCNEFNSFSKILNHCENLKKCSNSKGNLNQSSKDTIVALNFIQRIDQRIQNLSTGRGKRKQNQDKIQALQEQKEYFQTLYPWIAGKIFQEGYSENFNEEEVAELIKEQLSYTRTRLQKSMDDMKQAFSCIKENNHCRNLDLNEILTKIPPLNTENIFENSNSISNEQIQTLTHIQRTNLRKAHTAERYFHEVSCRQKVREDVKEANKELGFFALNIGLTLATAGLTSSTVAIKLLSKVGRLHKVSNLQYFNSLALNTTLQIPHSTEIYEQCDEDMNQLKRVMVQQMDESQMCEKMPIRSQLTSDFKRCLLLSSLATLPFIMRVGYINYRVARTNSKGIPKEVIEKAYVNSQTKPSIGRSVTDSERKAILKAHMVGFSEKGKDGTWAKIGNYTEAQLREKNKILKEAGFLRIERRRLIEDGVVGIKAFRIMDGKGMATEASIGREITDAQIAAVKKAHVFGFAQKGKDGTVARIGNWTDSHLKEKRRILKEAGFSKDEIQKLIDDYVV